ncbi:MAG: hypothetical protein M0R49_01180 [Limnochordia bacterium]|nr:hypothetical protein [Limnochordia bacterium]
MEGLTLTMEQVREFVREFPACAEKMKKLYPEAFKGEWVEVPARELSAEVSNSHEGFFINVQHHGNSVALMGANGGLTGYYCDNYRIEKGRPTNASGTDWLFGKQCNLIRVFRRVS